MNILNFLSTSVAKFYFIRSHFSVLHICLCTPVKFRGEGVHQSVAFLKYGEVGVQNTEWLLLCWASWCSRVIATVIQQH